jgi:CTP:molybdopterin cytidylyltransferase MocA
MGLPKALLDSGDGHTFLGRLVKVFEDAQLAPLVVLGAHADRVQAAHPEVPSVLNPNWKDGQLSSVFVGLRAALLQGAQRMLIHPVDTPMIAMPTVAQVRAALEHSAVVIPRCEGKTGHPLGMTAAAARTLLESNVKTLEEGAALLGFKEVFVDDPRILDNLNTRENYELRFGRAPTAR